MSLFINECASISSIKIFIVLVLNLYYAFDTALYYYMLKENDANFIQAVLPY